MQILCAYKLCFGHCFTPKISMNKINTLLRMEAELSEQTFEERLTYVRQKYLAYVHLQEHSPFVVVALHEHLGLANYLRIIVQALCNNEASIIIPNLFGEVAEQTNRSEEDDIFLKRLDQSMVAQTIWDIMEEVKSFNKKIILVGFSIGAAFALRMLEFVKGIEFAMLFYGLPPPEEIKPEKISARTIVYVGSKDKVKFLSNKQAQAACKLKYSENQLVEIYELQGIGHGFMNPASENYDEDSFNDCCHHFQQLLQK